MKVRVPGDKSLTQRALILAALADGTSRLEGLLWGGDAASTAGALRELGVAIPPLPHDGGPVDVEGVGLSGLRQPDAPLDLGNSGTGARLLCGVLAGVPLQAVLTGDASLRSRPMRRVTEPLEAMGARFAFLEADGRLPLRVEGAHPLRQLDWPTRVASAQVKSAILLAGLTGGAPVAVTEPRRSRDHTERMLRAAGVAVVAHPAERGWRVELRDPPERITPLRFRVPGDISSAAFVLAAAVLGVAPGPVQVLEVGLNPTRTAFLDVLRRMGAELEVTPGQEGGEEGVGEPVGDVAAAPTALRAVEVGGAEIPAMIDELPLVAVLGARARGTTVIRDAGELRAKESDRIRALVTNLRALGVAAEEFPDGLAVTGTSNPLRGEVRALHDHRIAMAFGVLAAQPGNDIRIDDPAVAQVSFPGFWEMLARLRGAAS